MLEGLKKWIPFKREEKKQPQQVNPESHPIAQLRRDMNQIFGRFFDNDGMFWPSSQTSSFDGWFGDFSPSKFSPAIDIADEPNHLKISADMPGIEAEDIAIDVRDHMLVIRGEKRIEESSKDDGYYRTERAYGMFERALPLPTEVDAGHAEATFDNGVLNIRLPKIASNSENCKRITVKSV